MIIDHTDIYYKARWNASGVNRHNGAYYYSIEIVNNIIPAIETSRNWVTVNQPGRAEEHSIVFIHNNVHPENYDWLKIYNDLILVCGVPSTVDKVNHIGRAIYLPLSIDVEEVKKHEKEKTRKRAYIGRSSKRVNIPPGTDCIEDLPRDLLLETMALYEEVYAVGRTAIEAKALGCKILPYDPRYPDTELWQVMDNVEAAAILQQKLDEIDKA